MSFSFRNIFTPEDGESGGGLPQEGGDSRHQKPYSPAKEGGSAGIRSQVFQVSELLPFIPPAIAAQGGIPMAKEVEIPLPADGSNDVFLSTLYQVCPELFAAEITPLNESTVTLPAKLSSAPPEPPAPMSSPFSPGTAFSKPPGMSSATPDTPPKSSPTPSGKTQTNPFWSSEENQDQPVSQPKPSNDMSEQRSQQKAPNGAPESKPPQGAANPSKPAEQGAPLSPFGAGPSKQQSAKASSPNDDAVMNGFSGPAAGGANPFEQTSAPEKKEVPKAAEPSPSAQFSGNPFESEEGYSTLFSSQADEDSDIPFPSPSQSVSPAAKESPAEAGAAPEGTWGSMFEAKPSPEDESGSTAVEKGFESIGNLIPGKSVGPAAQSSGKEAAMGASVEDEEDDYGLFLPPLEEEHEIPAAFKSHTPSDDASALSESAAPSKEAASAPSIAFEPLPSAVENGFAAAKTEPAPEPPQEKPPIAFSSPPVRAKGNAFSDSPVEVKPEPPVAEAAPIPSPEPAPVARPAQQLPPEPEVAPAPEVEQVAKIEPVVEQAPVPAAATAVLPGLSTSGEIRDLELRAIFSTSDSFTLRSVARRVVALSGIASCAIATPGRLVQASRNEESRIGDEAKEMVQTIRNLAKLTGLPDAQTFTLQTDRGIVSLFLDGECCLTVHHESPEFEPGTREKLILISRNLENLEK